MIVFCYFNGKLKEYSYWSCDGFKLFTEGWDKLEQKYNILDHYDFSFKKRRKKSRGDIFWGVEPSPT